MPEDAEVQADVVVVGFGAAGACAAIEAARAGAEVVVLDRFAGGGSTRLSGGVVYAGGGTPYQVAAGVKDTPEAMFDYLRLEVGDAVSGPTLRRFCDGSVEMIAWLEEQGVPFEASLCPYKTSYPSNDHYLYYSGSETAGGFRDAAPPAPRGHRTKAPGTSGAVLFERLAAAARAAGVRVMTQTAARGLVPGGVEAATLAGAPTAVRLAHHRLSVYASKAGLYYQPLRRALTARVAALEKRYARPVRVMARRGVVLSGGGFIGDKAMMREHAPAYRGGLALGSPGDDGSVIRLGTAAGGATDRLGAISAWRFITPPSGFVRGLAVGRGGERVCDESRYGAAIGDALVNEHGGRGWLLVDEEMVGEARRSARTETLWFQGLQISYLLRRGRVTGDTVEDVARTAGVDAAGLRATVDAYNAAAREGRPDPAGKPAEFVRPLDTGPYSLIDIGIRPRTGYPCPMLTLGGLVVDELTGQVLDSGGEPVGGLYAAGRSAVGLCSNSYVSGLSLADCVFSGRRAGHHAAAHGA